MKNRPYLVVVVLVVIVEGDGVSGGTLGLYRDYCRAWLVFKT